MRLAWGALLTAEERSELVAVAQTVGCDPSHLAAVIAFESRWNPAAVNASYGATGLIQFVPSTARALGTTVEDLAGMTRVEQLRYVLAYLRPYAGRLGTLADLYMAVLRPTAVGKPDDYPLITDAEGKVYAANRGLDLDANGQITKAEATALVARRLEEGLRDANVYDDGAPAAPIEDRSTTAAPPASATTKERPMGATLALALVQSLISGFAPLAQQRINSALTKHGIGSEVGAQLVSNVLNAVQPGLAVAEPQAQIAAVAAAQRDPAAMQRAEESAVEYLNKLAPILDRLHQYEQAAWAAEEASRNAAAERGERIQKAGPLLNNPTFIIAVVVLFLVAVVVGTVLWKDAVIAGGGFSTDMQAFVIGAIVGSALTAVLSYFFGTSRSSSAKDVVISELAAGRKA